MRPYISEQLPHTLLETHLNLPGERYQGKVRDVYRLGDRMLMVASDRLSAFDRILTTVPYKGEVLNRLAQFWFEKTSHVVQNHVIEVPDPNVTVARTTKPFAIEVVVRGYLTGSLWRDYQAGKHEVYGIHLPKGLKKDSAFPSPLITPSTKADLGNHDLPISEAEILAKGLASPKDWARICEAALALFKEGQMWAHSRGLLFVDTKYEFGSIGDELYVIDEIHTPDSSRFWLMDEYEERFSAGKTQKMLDKENIRQWLIEERNFSGEGEAPSIPDEVRADLAEKYLNAFEQISDTRAPSEVGPVLPRIEENLKRAGYLDR